MATTVQKRKTSKAQPLTFGRPFREQGTLGLRRRYLSKCGRYRVTVRISGPGCWPPRYYAEQRVEMAGTGSVYFSMIGNNPHRTKHAAIAACEREARRQA